jgi:hypothetical protein
MAGAERYNRRLVAYSTGDSHNLKKQIEGLLADALSALRDQLPQDLPIEARVERARDPRHGDFATNAALLLAKPAGMNPRELAERIVGALPAVRPVESVSIAGPGFINFRLSQRAFEQVAEILAADELRPLGRRRRPARAGGVRLRQSHRVRCTSATAGTRPTAPRSPTCWRPPATRSTASTTSTTPAADGHPRRERLAALPRGARRGVRFPANGYRGGYVQPIADQAGRQRARPAAAGPPPRCSAVCRPMRRGRQGRVHRRRRRADARAAWRGRLPRGPQAGTRRDPRRHPRTISPNSASLTTTGSRSAASRNSAWWPNASTG